MTLIDDAKTQFLKLWSVRFSLLLSFYGACQTAWALYDGKSVIMPVVVALSGILIAVSRVIKQDTLKADGGFEIETAVIDAAVIAAVVKEVLAQKAAEATDGR